MKQCITPSCLRSQWIKKRGKYLFLALLLISALVLFVSISNQFQNAEASYQQIEQKVSKNEFTKRRLLELDASLQSNCFASERYQGDLREATINSCLASLRSLHYYSSDSKSSALNNFVLAWEDLIDQRSFSGKDFKIRDYNVRKTAISDRGFDFSPFLSANDPDGSKYAAFVESNLAKKRENLKQYNPLVDAVVQYQSEQLGKN